MLLGNAHLSSGYRWCVGLPARASRQELPQSSKGQRWCHYRPQLGLYFSLVAMVSNFSEDSPERHARVEPQVQVIGVGLCPENRGDQGPSCEDCIPSHL